MHGFPLTIATLLAAIAIYIYAVLKVGGARGKYKVEAPAVTGDPGFERTFRAQQNTVEQMVVFLPLLGLAAYVWGDVSASIYGALWCFGRILYIETYSRGQSRSLGFMLSAGASLVVLIAVIVTLALRHFGVV